MLLKDKVALITGGAQGIGKAIAARFAEAGAAVAVADIDEEKAHATAAELEQSYSVKAMGLKVDVADFEHCKIMIKTVIDSMGKIDILVNNAGITRDTLLMRMSDDDWDKVIAINLKGVFNCCRAIARPMMKQRSGRIINISSVVGLMGNAGQANYAASKAGVIGLTKTVAKEFAPRGITVNAIAPGFIQTRMTERLPENVKNSIVREIPLQKLGSPDEIAYCARFMASDQAGYITGAVIRVDGGLAM